MKPPPPPGEFLKYPITVGVGILAVVVTIAWHSGYEISLLTMSFRAWHDQPWRLFTLALPHVGLIHLVFNLYWLWVFGSAVEAAFGHLRTAAIILFFAAGSAAAEFAVFEGGVGLSGVGYGLFGLLWVLGSRDERFHDVVDGQTAKVFVGWFFLCIAVTVTGIMRVGNVAHGMGALQGVLLGFALAAERRKYLAIGGLAGLTLVVVAAATIARPYVNLSGDTGEELATAAYLELTAENPERAAALLERAIRFDKRQAGWWYNLGVAYSRLDRQQEATVAFRHAMQLEPDDPGYQAEFTNHLAALAYRKKLDGELETAAELYQELVDLDERNSGNWIMLARTFKELGRHQAAIGAYEKAVALAPNELWQQEELETLRGQVKPRDK